MKARRARALGAIAEARLGNAWLRFTASLIAAVITYAVFDAELALVWIAGLGIVVGCDRETFRRLAQRCATGDPPPAIPRLIAWIVAQNAYGNIMAAILWFAPFPAAKTMAAIFLCGSLANAAATLRRSWPLSIAAVSSTVTYMLGLPLLDFVLDGARNPHLLVPLVGELLLLVWGVKLWRSLHASDAALAHAEASAMRERQASAAAADAKTEMLQRINAELRTPMTALMGAAEHLRRVATTPAARAHVAALMHAAQAVQRAIADVSDVGRFENGEPAIEPALVDPAELTRGVVAAFRAAAHDKGIELFLDAAADMPHVSVDGVRVRQVLSILIANAVRHTGHGGVRVRASAQGGADPAKARLAFTVADTGSGMSASQLQKNFGARFVGEGDLAIARRLTRALGGEIKAQSAPGQGTMVSFVVEAPITARAQDAA